MADLHEPSQPPRKHRVIHWNPVEDENLANQKPPVKAYIGGAAVALAFVVVATGIYFLFLRPTPIVLTTGVPGAESADADPLRAFESVSRAQGVQENVARKLASARQMPTTGHDVLRQMLINIEKENIEAERLMRSSSYARAIAQYEHVNTLIDGFSTEVENRQRAQTLYDSFLVRSDQLERGKNLNIETFEQAFTDASVGKNFLDQGSFTPALDRLQQATAKLAAVEASIQDFVRSNAAMGQRYIAQGKSEEAIQAFSEILEVEPANEDAVAQLERARVADRAFGFLQEGDSHEQAGRLEDALIAFEEASRIDAASAKAQSGVSRVRRKIEDRDFNYHYDRAQAAIAEQRYEEAIDGYQSALAIYPNRDDLRGEIERARAEKHQNDIITRVTRAYDYERDYDWVSARDLYQELVNMEPDLKEAKDGLLRTGRMIRNILRYETMIEAAKTEAQRAEFQQAVRTFDRAMQAKPAYLALTEEGERLRSFLQLQSQPVPVQVTSDESTWVSIQGPTARKPERFKQETINLLPGKYFIIGRKKGFQDVRINLQVRAGMAIDPITIICDTKQDY